MKPDQRFSPTQLGYMRKARSQAHFSAKAGPKPRLELEWHTFLSGLSNDVQSGAYSFGPFRRVAAKRKTALTLSFLEDVLVARKLNDIIRRAYGVRQPDRRRQIETLLTIAKEASDKTIVRLDIKSCFESISRKELFRRLDTDGLVEAHAIRLIRQYFTECDSKLLPHERRGLPRGLLLSTTLAEVFLSPMEAQLRKVDGVFAVLRYVDDLLIFSTKAFPEALDGAQRVISNYSLKTNPRKLEHIQIVDEKIIDGGPNLEFLGYKFVKLDACPKGNHKVLLANGKMRKIKRRIALSFSAYKRGKDAQLLEARIRALADNLRITTSGGKTGLYSGLAFSHPFYSGDFDDDSLSEVNSFFRQLLRRYNPPDEPNSKLWKICFKSGHEHRRRLNFTPKVARQIKECWKYEN